jgi:hypothetical protein
MAKLTRKNLMVNAEELRAVAQQRGVSESEAVRELVAFALAAREVGDALRELHDRGGLMDIYDEPEDEDELFRE